MLLKIAFMALMPQLVRAGVNAPATAVEEHIREKLLMQSARKRLLQWVPLSSDEADTCMCGIEALAREMTPDLNEEFLLDIVDYRIYELTGQNTPRRQDIKDYVSGKCS